MGIVLLSPDGRRGRLVVRPRRGVISDLLWCPNGRYLAYTRCRWAARLMVLDLHTGRSRRVRLGGARSVALAGYAWISPTELVVSTFRRRDAYKRNGFLVRCDVESGACHSLTDDGGAPLIGVRPSSTADGRRVAFVTYGDRYEPFKCSITYVEESLRVVDTQNGRVWTAVVDSCVFDEAGDTFDTAVLSPNGRWIFTASSGSDIGFYPRVFATNGQRVGARRYACGFGGVAWNPVEPDYVVYAGSHGLSHPFTGLFGWRAGRDRITNGMRILHGLDGLAWSPAGRRIAYIVHRRRGTSLWVARRDGTGRRRVAVGVTAPAWARTVLPAAP